MATMAIGMSRQSSSPSTFPSTLTSFKGGLAILLGLTLVLAPAPAGFTQTTQQQQEEQRREQQQRDEQAREQQRQEQQREQQAREQQQREQQARERQQREEQERQREEQAREQQRQEQQREQQAREQQQREEQEPQRQILAKPINSAPPALPSINSSGNGSIPTDAQVPDSTSKPKPRAQSHTSSPLSQTDTKRAPEPPRSAASTESAGRGDGKNAEKDQGLAVSASDPKRGLCEKGPCAGSGPEPVQPDGNVALCKVGHCPICAPGQSPGKDHACVPAIVGNGAVAPPKPSIIPQTCAVGQVWNGIQCAPTGAQRCEAGQGIASPSCQAACAAATGGAQNYIALLRMARQDKDQACMKDPAGTECQQAEGTYNIRLNEYRNFLAGIPGACTGLPDPISI